MLGFRVFWGASSGERVGANLTSPPGDMASAGRKLIGSERWPCAVSVGALRPGSLSSGGAQRTSARHGRCQRVALVLRDERPAFRLQLLIEMQPPPVEPLRCLVRRASSSFSNAPIEHDAHIARQPDRAERFLIYVGVVDRSGVLAPSRLRVRGRYHAQVSAENGGGPGIRTPKGLAPRRISSPLPCQLRLALRARCGGYLRYLDRRPGTARCERHSPGTDGSRR